MSEEILPVCVCPLVSSYTVGGCRCAACKKVYNAWRHSPEIRKRRKAYEERLDVSVRRKKYQQERWKCDSIRNDLIAKRHKKEVRLRQLVDGIKLERGCYDCGYRANPVALQFDHVRGKKLHTIASLVHSLSEKTLIAELEKCEVRCANCHFIMTQARRKKS